MLETAILASKRAGNILESYFGVLKTYEAKDNLNRDLVTIADKESEAVIKKTILTAYPDHGFWGEEGGQDNMNQEYIWIVDPLDGTSNFILNIPLFSVSIALMYKQEIILGVVYIPKTGEIFVAEKGRGAFCNDKKITVSNVSSLDQSVCSIEYWSKDNISIDQGLADFVSLARKTKKIRYLSSTIFELCRVAKGNLDFCILDTFFLDVAAAKLIIEEAGGICTLYTGAPITITTEKRMIRIIASNQSLRHTLVK